MQRHPWSSNSPLLLLWLSTFICKHCLLIASLFGQVRNSIVLFFLLFYYRCFAIDSLQTRVLIPPMRLLKTVYLWVDSSASTLPKTAWISFKLYSSLLFSRSSSVDAFFNSIRKWICSLFQLVLHISIFVRLLRAAWAQQSLLFLAYRTETAAG